MDQFAPQPASLRMFSEARDCLQRGDYQQAIQILHRVHALDPANDRVLVQLGYAYAMSYDFPAAERHFENAIRISSSKTDAVMAIAHHWMDARNFEVSTKYFERALQQSPVPIMAFVRLAELYIRLRRLDEAAEVAQRALQLDPAHPGALLMRGKVHRQMRQLDDAEKLLRTVASHSAYDADARAAAGYELGTVLDQQARYDEAMSALVAAKDMMRATANSGNAPATLRGKLARTKQMQETFSAALLQRWRKCGANELQPPRRLALLGGYARSGTTLLEYVLDSHPQIVSADETYVFHSKAYPVLSGHLSASTPYLSAMDSISTRNLRQLRTEYFRGIESSFGQPIGDRLLIDKNPGMTFDIPLLLRIFPEIKILVALRDPRDVCLSCFMQAAPAVADAIPWLTLEGTTSHYASIMGLWLALKPMIGPAALEVRYEDLVENLESTARRTLDFLGFAWDERVLRFNEHALGKTIRSPTYAEVTKPIFKSAVGRWRNYQKYFEPHLEKLAPFCHAFGYETG